ncbi:MAG: hypothetical protein M1827_004834 [Pycnora praestabilis]|nr:MAG: hypothetical protein M1827_004834 [Pycnora praestabilis]
MFMGSVVSLRIRIIAGVVVIFLISITYLTPLSNNISRPFTHVGQPPPKKCPPTPNCPPPSVIAPEDWEFNVDRDGDDYGLTDEQCQAAFPKLFGEIEASVARRKENPITFEELNLREMGNSLVRGMVYEGDLLLIHFGNMDNTFSRALATLHSLNRALTAAPNRRELPNIEFEFVTEDVGFGEGPYWTYTKRDQDERAWLMPDFAYWSWPEVKAGAYNRVRHRIKRVDDGVIVDGQQVGGLDFFEKDKRLVWRGNVQTAPKLRGAFVDATKNKPWADVKALDWASKDDIKSNLLPMEEHCKYMFLAHTEGHSFSGRGKYLQNCRSVFVAHKLEWKEAHHGALIATGPGANYVEVDRNFTDLEAKIEYLIAHPEDAKKIADNSINMFRDRYLTPAAEACYWRRLIRAWRSVSFEPDFYSDLKTKKWRGVPFESFILTRTLEWDAH